MHLSSAFAKFQMLYNISMSIKKAEVLKRSYLNIFSLTIVFVAFSILGFLLEGFWSVISFGRWDNHYALVWGPFTIIYGFAVVGIMLLHSLLANKNFFIQFLVCFVLGSIFEFVASWLQELAFGTRSWNYFYLPLNLDGRICLRMSLVWGFVGVAFLRLFAAKLIILAQKMNSPFFAKIGFVLFAFMICNFAISILATARYSERHFGRAPRCRLEELIDERFPDERMRNIYYNMEFTR